MSFTISTTTDERVCYPKLEVTLPSTVATIEVTYEVTGLTGLSGTTATAQYFATVNGTRSSVLSFTFEYSGTGNPIDEAEAALQASLS